MHVKTTIQNADVLMIKKKLGVLFTAKTPNAKVWAERNIQGLSWLWPGGSFVIPSKTDADEITAHYRRDGFRVFEIDAT